MNMRQIEAFRAIIETGTVSRAAERLSISQPAATKLLKHLEQTIGFALFDRIRGRLSPTAEAIMLYDEVERVYRGISSLERFTEDIRLLQNGILRVGTMPALSIGFIQDIVADFTASRPSVQVTLHTRTSPKLIEWLVGGQLDAGFTSHPPNHPEVVGDTLCSTEFVCILPREHRLAAKTVIHATDLAGEQFISFGSDTPYRHQLDEMFKTLGVERKLLYETPMAPAACAMVARGLGVTVLNPHYLGAFKDLLVARPFRPKVESDIRIVLPRYRRPSLIAQAFVETAKTRFAPAVMAAAI